MEAMHFSVTGEIADVDDTVEFEPAHPALVLIVEIDADFARVVVPREAWSMPRDLVQVGGRVRLFGSIQLLGLTPAAPPVAHRVELIDRLH